MACNLAHLFAGDESDEDRNKNEKINKTAKLTTSPNMDDPIFTESDLPCEVNSNSRRPDKKLSKRQKRLKARQIKKILKERLNINCLRMLAEDSHEDDGGAFRRKKKRVEEPNNGEPQLGDSYFDALKEIGAVTDYGLSAGFLERHGEAQK